MISKVFSDRITCEASVKGVKAWEPVSGNSAKAKKTTITADKTISGNSIFEGVNKDGKKYRLKVVVEDPAITSSEITLSKKNKYKLTMKEGEVVTVSYKYLEQQPFYKSSKPETAFATGSGTIIANQKGKTKLTAKINGKTVTINVEVK